MLLRVYFKLATSGHYYGPTVAELPASEISREAAAFAKQSPQKHIVPIWERPIDVSWAPAADRKARISCVKCVDIGCESCWELRARENKFPDFFPPASERSKEPV